MELLDCHPAILLIFSRFRGVNTSRVKKYLHHCLSVYVEWSRRSGKKLTLATRKLPAYPVFFCLYQVLCLFPALTKVASTEAFAQIPHVRPGARAGSRLRLVSWQGSFLGAGNLFLNRLLVLWAFTAMAMAATSSISSSDALASLATARPKSVQESQPAARAAPNATSCLVL